MPTKKKRAKKYIPKEVSSNPFSDIFGGMSGKHAEHLQRVLLSNSLAMQALAQGTATVDQWKMLNGAVNVGIIMCEQGTGREYRTELMAATAVMCELGKRFNKIGKFLFTGEELTIMNEFVQIHEAQLSNVRSGDIDKASKEVIRRVQHKINCTNVKTELAKDAARLAEVVH